MSLPVFQDQSDSRLADFSFQKYESYLQSLSAAKKFEILRNIASDDENVANLIAEGVDPNTDLELTDVREIANRMKAFNEVSAYEAQLAADAHELIDKYVDKDVLADEDRDVFEMTAIKGIMASYYLLKLKRMK